jgi:hypothetical protein
MESYAYTIWWIWTLSTQFGGFVKAEESYANLDLAPYVRSTHVYYGNMTSEVRKVDRSQIVDAISRIQRGFTLGKEKPRWSNSEHFFETQQISTVTLQNLPSSTRSISHLIYTYTISIQK